MTQIVSTQVGRHSVRRLMAKYFPNSPDEFHEPRNLPGEFLTMSDGERWFHPFDGGPPCVVTT
jgi:hypothetical protein